MSTWNTIWRSALVLVLLLGAIGGGVYAYKVNEQKNLVVEASEWKNKEAHEAVLTAKLQGLSEKIRRLAGNGGCNRDADCDAIGLGAKTCDKYDAYFHYSLLTVEQSPFEAAVHEFNSLKIELSSQSLSAKKCGVDKPIPACINGQCTPNS